jgi:glycosyltransferase involved in cell wall biosynthesis
MECDLVVFQRPASPEWLDFVKVARKAGKLVVSDYDDDPFTTSPWNPAYRFCGVEEVGYKWPDGRVDMLWSEDMVGSKGETEFFNIERNIKYRDTFMASFKKSDMVTCTTPILQETFKKINQNVAVLPNLIDFDLFPKVEYVKRQPRILWQGGNSHYEDLISIVRPLHKIVEKHDVKFIYFGDMHLSNVFNKFPKDKIEFHHWIPQNVYPYKLATLNADIGLCPVVDNIFNRNKSAIKWFEYSVMNIATIASDLAPYSPVMTNEKDGLLVKDEQGWFDAMERLIIDAEKRKELAKNAYDAVYNDHNADKKANLWSKAYDELLKRPL